LFEWSKMTNSRQMDPKTYCGDFSYIQSKWMLIPLLKRNLHGIYDDYNYKQSNTRTVVEQGFERLMDLWRILHHPIWNPNEKLVPKLIYICYNDIVGDDVPFVGHHDESRR
jgi:hypothetical protein